MKKLLVSVVAALATMMSFAQEAEGTVREAESFAFGYDAGADVVSAYLWRGQYNGGLSFQPTLDLGWDSEHTSFRFGTWWNVGASDWGFRKGLPETEEGNPNTYFVPEVDIYANFNIWGATLVVTHFYYFGGSPFFCWDKIDTWMKDDGVRLDNNTSTTEISVGYDFSTLALCGLYFNWNTTIAGNDFQTDEEGEYVLDDKGRIKRNFTSYLELGYNYTWDEPGITLGGAVGMVPWASATYGNSKFAVNNLTLNIHKAWEFDACELDLYAIGSINPDLINKENAYIKASGDNKVCQQQLNGCIGLGIWF